MNLDELVKNLQRMREKVAEITHKKHSLDDFKTVVSVQLELYNQALRGLKIHPAKEETKELQTELDKILGKIGFIEQKITEKRSSGNTAVDLQGRFKFAIGGNLFQFYVPEKEISAWKKTINNYKTHFYLRERQFSELDDEIGSQMELTILPITMPIPGIDRNTYLRQGRLILPVTTTPTYHVFSIFPEEDSVIFKQLTEYGVRSVEGAVELYVDPRMLGTVVLARNTEDLPVEATVLPILKKKYGQKLYHY